MRGTPEWSSNPNEDAKRMEKLATHIPRDPTSRIWAVKVIASTHAGVRRTGETIITHANSQVGAVLHALACTQIEAREDEDLTLFVETVQQP